MVSKKPVTPDVNVVPKQNSVKLPQYNYEEIAQDPYKHVITFIEKKIRNMDKRKGKLEGYKRIKQEGGTLDHDQEVAMKKYEEVAGGLDFAKELVKVFSMISAEVQKVNMQAEEQRLVLSSENDFKTSQFVTRALHMLQLISSIDGIRDEVVNGEDGMSEEDFDLLLTFYDEYLDVSFKAGDNALVTMDSVSEHLYLMKQESTNEIAGTTYAHLNKSFLHLCENQCFMNYPEFTTINHVEENKDGDETISSPANEDYQENVEDEIDEESVPPANDAGTEEIADDETEDLEDEDDDESAEIITTEFVASQEPRLHVEEIATTTNVLADAPEEPAIPVENKPAKKSIHEVLAEVQGKYSFLQDSMIDFEVSNVAATSLPAAGLPLSNQLASAPTNEINLNSTAPTQSYENAVVDSSASMTPNIHQTASHYAPLTSSDASIPIQQTPSDNLGMGQTTFGGNNSHNIYNSEAPSLAKPIPDNAFASNFHQNVHQPSASEEALALQMQMAAVGSTTASSSLPSIVVPDPPKSHIPLPNEEVSYKAYLPSEINHDSSANEASSMQYGMIGGGNSPQLVNSAEAVLPSTNTRISQNNGGYMENESRTEGLPANDGGDDTRTEPKLEPSVNDDMDHRMNGNNVRYQNTNGFVNKRQQYNNGGNGYYSRGGGYRQNNQRGYYDNNMSNHRNFSNSGNNYNQYNTHYNNRQENGAYGGNMRRNNNGNRGNRGNNSRGNNTRPGSSYNRSRTFRPQHQTEQGY